MEISCHHARKKSQIFTSCDLKRPSKFWKHFSADIWMDFDGHFFLYDVDFQCFPGFSHQNHRNVLYVQISWNFVFYGIACFPTQQGICPFRGGN